MKEITEFLVKTVEEASKLITDDFKIKAKDDQGDIVTSDDIKVEKYITGKIKEKYPDYDIVSEEFNSKKEVTNNCFVIDPIDGTVNYANHIPFWCIQVACVSNGELCASVIYAPKLNELYYADETGTYLNGNKIRVSKLPLEKGLFCIDGKHPFVGIQKMLQKYRHPRRFCSTGLEFAYVARGIFTGMYAEVMVSPRNVWDYYPGMYLIKQAGGVFLEEKKYCIGANNGETLNKINNQAPYTEKEKLIIKTEE